VAGNEASRRYFAAARAVSHELQRASGWALLRAALVVIPVGFLGAVAAGFIGVTEEIGPTNPPAAVASGGALLLVFVGAYAILLWRRLGSRLGAALDVIEWADRETRAEWAAATQGSAIPRTPRQASRWLDAHPETEANQPQRVAASLIIGDVATARDALSRYPVDTAFERHQRAADGLAVNLVAGGTASASEIEAANRELGVEHRHHAATCRAMTEAVAAVLTGGDWQEPLARARHELPEGSTDAGRRKVWWFYLAIQVVVATLFLGVVLVLWLLVLS
jgi:hypothetical protein